ncbi:MAG: serine--tRNA ligase [Bacteroidetes bacterium GWC2_33_15]|nr:MAG: serine--tRNA ligase [Bacteroidetes bacterium GWA2_33_15]OFX52579.1 MAG: serine--tRNA ligase [Bacteroidetes bacterium GWC2_33_15]OFX63924.1 MAG: serine--tRNA ligase [Bacteroidetes bacterium GWB2_32_14]OFX70809.1 MAG: serine--tRNA ligase [Bacteroidetes bacterium GWD2_33_33]HAN19937.1 serine--tRNA ligase [Bacteroidales bacterium]
MLTLKVLQENKEYVIERLAVKNFKAENLINQILELDQKRRSTQNSMDSNQAELNKLAKEIGELFKNGKQTEANELKNKNAEIKNTVKIQGDELASIEKQLNSILVQLPNLPHKSVPAGKGADDNKEIRSGGSIPQLPENALAHWDLAKKYDIIDFELGNKLTGSGFPVYKGKGAKLQRALINFFLEEAILAGYTEYLPPILVNEDSGFGTGQLPDKEGQMYHVGIDNLYLIPTAEVPVTNIYRDVILSVNDFPVKMTAYTPCFRREAGSYGKDVRGLNRLHQFDKVEIVQIQHPEKSYQALEEMVNHVENLVKSLNLPYRILQLCGGDMSFTSALTYDFEVYSAAQDKWLEVSSVSNFESYQANRLKLRYKDENDKKTTLVHTLNGSALALPRIVAALLENNQTNQGIIIPEVLRKFTGFDRID